MVDLWNEQAPAGTGPNTGDFASTFFKVGMSDVAAALPAGVRYLADQVDDSVLADTMSAGATYLQHKISDFGDDAFDELSPAAQQQLSASMTSPEFWESPFSSTMLKLTRMSPSVVASVAAVVFAPEAIPAMVTLGAVGGGLTAGQTLDEIYAQVDDKSDEELLETPLYRGMRASGMSEEEARKQLSNTMIGAKPAMLFALGALTNNLGPAGQIVRGAGIGTARKAVTGSLAGRTAKEFGIAAGAEGVQTGAEAYAGEQAGVDGGLKSAIDVGAVASATLEGAVLGGVIGGVAGAVTGSNPNPRKKAVTPEVTQPAGPDQAQAAAIAASQGPPNATQPPPTGAGIPAGAGAPVAPTQGPQPNPAAAPNTTPRARKAKAAELASQAFANPEAAPGGAPAPAQPAAPVPPKVTPQVEVVKKRAAVATPAKAAVAEARGEAPKAGPRIFSDAKADAAAAAANAKRIKANLKAIEKEEAGPQGKHRSKADRAKRAADAAATKKIFDTHVPDTQVVPATPEEHSALRARLQRILDDAKESNVSLRGKVTYASTPDHVIWLKEVSDLAKALKKDGGASAKHITEFIVRETAAKGGDFSVMRAGRLADGELLKRKDQGDSGETADAGDNSWTEEEAAAKEAEADGVGAGRADVSDAVGDSADPMDAAQQDDTDSSTGDQAPLSDAAIAKPDERAVSKDDVATKTARSAKRTINTFDEERAGQDSPALSVSPEVEAEIRARYETMPSPKKAGAKTDEVRARVATRAVEKATRPEAPKPKLEPKKAGPKTELIKKRVAEKAAAPKAPHKAPPKVTKKVASVQERVKAARADTDPAPTEAQKKAGNYRKGKVSWEGVRLVVETAKGTMRRGVSQNGVEWAVKITNDYGSVSSTVGMDGDQVDVFIGPNLDTSDFVMVIDQVDPDTKAPDEHKAMLGFANAAAAQNAYLEAFSDGRAADRVGDVTIMSIDEFKAWLKDRKATQQPAGDPEMVAAEVAADAAGVTSEGTAPVVRTVDNTPNWRDLMEKGLVELDDDLSTLNLTEKGRAWEAPLPEFNSRAGPEAASPRRRRGPATPAGVAGSWVRKSARDYELAKSLASKRMLASTALDVVAKDLLPDFIKWARVSTDDYFIKFSPAIALAPRMLARVKKAAGDAELLIIPDDKFYGDKLFGGLGKNPRVLGQYNGFSHFIVLPESALNTHQGAIHTIIHEVAHAAYVNTMWSDSKLRADVQAILDEARKYDYALENKYGLENVDEFIAEAMSNPEFQTFLANTPAGGALKAKLNLDGSIRSVWDMIVASFRRALHLGKEHDTLLHATMKVMPRLEEPGGSKGLSRAGQIGLATDVLKNWTGPALESGAQPLKSPAASGPATSGPVWGLVGGPLTSVREAIAKATDPGDRQDQKAGPWLIALQTMDQLARSADRYFGSNNPVRKVVDLVERMRVQGDRNLKLAEPLLTKLRDLERTHKASGKWAEFTELVHAETMSGAFADRPLDQQPHLGKDALHGKWGKAQHAELATIYARMPNDLRAARKEAMAFFTEQQNKMSLGIIRNRILVALGVPDDGLAKRIHEGTTTDADAKLVGPRALELILEAKELAKIKGPYFPLMRRGDFVVSARFKINPPANALRQINDNTWEFSGPKAREQAIAFGNAQSTRPTTRSIWVDKSTGERFGTEADGTEVRITSKDADAEQRFRVVVQDRYTAFHDTAKAAEIAAAELAAEGLDVYGVEARRYEPTGGKVDMLSSQMQAMVHGLESRGNLGALSDAQKNELVQALNIESMRVLGSTRIQNRRLPRTYVEGASRDLTRNTLEYSRSSSGYLAKLQFQPELDAAIKEMDAAVRTSDYGKDRSLARSEIANAIKERVLTNNGMQEGGAFSPVVSRILTLSFVDKLASASYSMINATQPILITTPVLAGRFGPGRAFRVMSQAYNDVSAFTITKKGLEDILSRIKSIDAQGSDLLALATRKLSRNEGAMVQHLVDVGVIDASAGLEISQFAETSSNAMVAKGDTALRYLEGIARQLPTAVEMINRTTSAVAAYRLELERSGSHDIAVRYAQDTVNQTQFNYSNTNAAPIFNHPLMRIPLQFKKFGQGMYALLGHQIGKAIRNENPGDRAEAIKSLAYITAAHVVVAGTLGLPTEPIKALLMSANVIGLTGLAWSDVEEFEREIAANMFGPGLGEMVTRGATRGLGVDVSSRLGLDNLMIFGEPRSNDSSDVKAYLFDLFGGAPTSLVMQDWVPGMNALLSGELVEAAEKLVPIKTVSDTIKAYRTASEGKKSSTGTQMMSPYSLGEAAIRSIGFTPSRESENRERQTAFFTASQRQTEQRRELLREWAEGGARDKSRVWIEIQRWNRKRDRGAQISMSDLRAYAKRSASDDRATVEGLRPTVRDQQTYKKVDAVYNY